MCAQLDFKCRKACIFDMLVQASIRGVVVGTNV
jgi:hypothetical protein